LTSFLTALDLSVLQIKTKIVSCHSADSKPVRQEVNGTVILPPLVFPDSMYVRFLWAYQIRREVGEDGNLLGESVEGVSVDPVNLVVVQS
jgi:hypothetical protein